MRSCVLLFTFVWLPAFAQTIIGAVDKIDKAQIQLKTKDGMVIFRADEKTSVTKIRKSNDLSILAIGDEVRVNYYGEGTLTAVNITTRVMFTGVVTEARSGSLMVQVASAADQNAPVFVYLDRATLFATNRALVTAGRKIQVVGWDAGNRVVEAEKIAMVDSAPVSDAAHRRRE